HARGPGGRRAHLRADAGDAARVRDPARGAVDRLRRADGVGGFLPAARHCAGRSESLAAAPRQRRGYRAGRAMTAAALLTVNGLTIRFGGLTAIEDLSLEVREGEVLALIGPNGAGKTSAFNAITGYLAPNGG